MDTIMKPGEEVTGRIRWEQPVLTLYGYVAGETKVAAFTIWPPEGDGRYWTLTSSFPGQMDQRVSALAPGLLRKAAEAWVAEFVASLGAVFPDAALKLADRWEAEATRLDRRVGEHKSPEARQGLAVRATAHEDCARELRQVLAPSTPAPMAGEKENGNA